jgi:hypothetical protein
MRTPTEELADNGGAATNPPTEDQPGRDERGHPRRRRALLGLVALALIAVVVVVLVDQLGGEATPSSLADNADPTSVGTVVLRDLTSQTQVSATLGYSGSYNVVNQAQGTVTSLPAIGQIVSLGQVLYEVNGSPVILLYGATPAYRPLSEGASTAGADVEELNEDLVALGYLTAVEIGSDPSTFTFATKEGVEKLQAALGVTENGTLSLGQAVFLPTAARITAVATNTVLGGSAQPGSQILSATSTGRVVTIDLNADQQGEVALGDKVTITLPNGDATPGTVSSVGTVATTPSAANGGSTPTITVLVTPNNPNATGTLDQAPVEVAVTTGSAPHALVVPVDALLALSSGGYALEVIGGNGAHTLEPVRLGLFDDADELVQVTGPAVRAGERIVVPAS